MYCSSDGGFNWEICTRGLPDCYQGDMQAVCFALQYESFQVALAVSKNFTTDRRVFFAYAGRLYMSDDAGQHWNRLNFSSNFTFGRRINSPGAWGNVPVLATTYPAVGCTSAVDSSTRPIHAGGSSPTR